MPEALIFVRYMYSVMRPSQAVLHSKLRHSEHNIHTDIIADPIPISQIISSIPASMTQGWRQLDVGVLGGGIGGMSVAIALRRAGHRVTIYEKHDFAGEVGASVSCAANGTRWLHEWGVDVEKGDPVVLKKLINRDWHTGEPVSTFDLDDYEEKWGYVYNMFHRQYMHRMLKDCALQEEGEGTPVKLLVNHAVSV